VKRHRHPTRGRLTLVSPARLVALALGTAAVLPGADTVSFRFATQTLTVPAGFTVELVAAPPLVNRPISVATDEQGRLYATDSSGLSDRAPKQFEEKPHRVVRLEDTDGNGVYDRATTFADRMMFPQGALFHDGSLYVAAPPHIWKLTDRDGDGIAETRTAWWDGQTLTGCANDVHGPYLGPDGWFYWTKGAFAEQKHTLGTGKPFVTRAAHIYRARPDGTGFEPVLTGGMDNPVGVAFSSRGERFLSGTFFQTPGAGLRDGLIHALYGGVYGKENPASDGHPRTGDLMPVMTHMGAAAPCGSTAYRSRIFGDAYADNLFVCYFNLHKIVRHQLIPDGASYRTRDTDFITSDSPDFHPTDVLEDADGSLLVVDTGGWYKICCPTSQLAKPDVLGGIYRIRRTGAPKVEDPRGLRLAWSSLPPAGLTALLADPRPDVRDRAMENLRRVGAAAVPDLARATREAAPAARQLAVWTLARIPGEAARAAVRGALVDRDSAVVHAALQVVSLWRDAAAFEALAWIVTGADPALGRLAAEALGRLGDPRGVEPLLAALGRLPAGPVTSTGTPENPIQRATEHALLYALIEIGRPEGLRPHLRPDGNPRLGRAAIVALDQMENGGLQAAEVVPWLGSTVPALRQTAAWVVSHRPDWGDALAGFLAGRLASPAATTEATTLSAQLAQLAKSTSIQTLLAETVSRGKGSQRSTALRAMATATLKEPPAAWLAALATALGQGDAALTGQVVATARALTPPKGGHPALTTALVRVGHDTTLPAEVRLDSLLAVPAAALTPVSPELFAFLRGNLDPARPLGSRGAAAAVLARAPLTADQQLELTAVFRTVGALEAPKLLPAFERGATEDLGRALLAALRGAPGLAGIRPAALRPVFAKYPPAVRTEAEQLIASLDADAIRQNARVDELLVNVRDGDVRRGQAVFLSDKAACTLCHQIGYRGGKLGPDLTNIGRIRGDRELLEAVLYPSATLVRGYEPMVVTTRSGETHSGIVRKDTADELVLATGPESEQRLARADIRDIQPGAVSPMPPGMEAILSGRELGDLVAFLKSRQ
jgi:putative membrane-bound dehydrogenase-like protein